MQRLLANGRVGTLTWRAFRDDLADATIIGWDVFCGQHVMATGRTDLDEKCEVRPEEDAKRLAIRVATKVATMLALTVATEPEKEGA